MGATGYVGRSALEALWAETVMAVRDVRALPDGRSLSVGDVVVNCAGSVGFDQPTLEAVNVELARDVARHAAAAGAHLIHVSSAAVFDGVRRGRVDEASSPQPVTAYGRSKARGEDAVRAALPEARIVRPSKVIGGDDPRRRLHALILHAGRGRPLPVPPREPLWANFVSSAQVGTGLREIALHCTTAPSVVHLTATVPWVELVSLLEAALGRPVGRLPRALTAASGRLAEVVARLPAHARPRHAQRLLEIWDLQEFTTSRTPVPADGLAQAIEQIARTYGLGVTRQERQRS